MNHFAGLDVSLEWTSVCVVDAEGGVVREAKVASEPAALAAFFTGLDFGVTRICLEAGPLSQWLHDGLAEAGLPVVCAETRQLKAGALGDGEQERPRRRARDRPAGSREPDSPGAREDGVEPGETHAPRQPKVHAEAAVRRRGPHPGHAAQLRAEDGQGHPPRAERGG